MAGNITALPIEGDFNFKSFGHGAVHGNDQRCMGSGRYGRAITGGSTAAQLRTVQIELALGDNRRDDLRRRSFTFAYPDTAGNAK